MISVILPTYNEAENITSVIQNISSVLTRENLQHEIIVIDDNSPDGTAQICAELENEYYVRTHIRKGDRGLSKSIIRGLELAKGEICVVMDADLSHPAEALPLMINPLLEHRFDATVGSRHLSKGGFGDFSIIRKIISRLAGLMAKGVTDIRDRTSGFMAIRKDLIEGMSLDPTGWKIVLEIMVKANPKVLEVPIVFSERKEGKSKLGIKAQADYLRHLCRLYCFKYPSLEQFYKFCMVGFSGLLIDIAILLILVDLFFLDPRVAAIYAFSAAVSWNYFLNRSWTFADGKMHKIYYSYPLFFVVALMGLGVRIGLMHLLIEYLRMGEGHRYVLASLIGIAAGTVTNFLGSKYLAFSRK